MLKFASNRVYRNEAALRRLVGLLVLIILLVATVGLNRLTHNWHYVLPVEPGQVAYIAAFDGFTDDWSQYQGVLTARIADGVLRLTADDMNSGPFSAARQHFSDFDLRVQAAPVAGPADNGYGVIFRLQDNGNTDLSDDSYYWFLISSDGYYQVMRVLNGESKRLSDWIPSDAILPGLNVTNTLRVVATGNRFRFYVNNQPLPLCVPDNPDGESTFTALNECVQGQMVDELVDAAIANGRIGVIAHTFSEPGVVVEFDNLVVLGP